jgi:hypothetical protein
LTIPTASFSPLSRPLSVTGVVGYSLLFDLQQQYAFMGIEYNTAGATAYVLQSSQPGPGVDGDYLVRPSDGALFPYDGSGTYDNTLTGTPLAVLGANVFTDPTLLLNAQPPADYATLQALQQQYQFTGVGYFNAGAPAYVLHSNLPGPAVGGYYLIRPSDGDVFAYDGSGNYTTSFAGTPLSSLGANVYSFPDELTNSQAAPSLYAQLYQVNSQLDLQEFGGSFYTNNLGHQAEWLYSPLLNQYGQHWYTLILSGGQSVLHAWEGYQDSSVGAIVATFNTPTVHDNPTLLTNASFLPEPDVTVTPDGSGNLTVGLPSAGFVGAFQVVVTATDGLVSASQTVTVTSTDTAPTLTVQQNGATVTAGTTLSVPHGSFSLADTVTTTGNQPVTMSASVSSYSQLFSLEQQFRFQPVGVIDAGGLAYVFTAAGDNAFGNAYYLLSPTGELSAYDGSGNYATSFARTPLATLSASVYSDPTLLINAQPPVDYAALFALQQQHQFRGVGYFTSGSTAYVLQSSQPGPGVGGFYLLTADGNLYAFTGGSYTDSITSANLLASLDPGVYANPSLLLNAEASPGMYHQLQQAEQMFDLQELPDGFHTGLMGNAAKWLHSPVANSAGTNFYTLVLAAGGTRAQLYAWDGGSNSVPVGAAPVAVFDPSVYANPALLQDANAPEAATGVTVALTPTSPGNGTLTIHAPPSFVGTFQVTVTATDGVLTTTESFQVASTDTAPVPTSIPNQTASAAGSPVVLHLSSTDPEGDPVTYSATAVSAPSALQQQYGFTGVGYITAGGVTAYVLRSDVPGGFGGYYLLSSTGGVYAYDGSGNFASTFADGHNQIATLSPAVYTTPSLLTSAVVLPADVVSVNNNATPATLTLDAAGLTPGTLLQVFVTASDGAEITATSFLVTVTA